MTGQSRQLAAIMYTDVVGYTGMMQRNEKDTIDKLEHHRMVLGELVTRYGGEILQYYGDGSLIIFNSTLNAVLCALKIQEIFRQAAIPLRIGIHLGEVILQNGSAFGDGLNIAARLEAIGVKGSVLISGAIFDQIHNQPEIKVRYLGRFRLKNVRSPLQVYSISNQGITIPPKATVRKKMKVTGKPVLVLKREKKFVLMLVLFLVLSGFLSVKYYFETPPDDGIHSMAVLPFENLSEDSSQDNFCEGLTEEVQAQLSKISGLKIIPGMITSRYSFTDTTIQQIGKELGAKTVLRGTIRKSGRKLRVFAELIDTGKNYQLWSEIFDIDKTGNFKLQVDIADRIVSALRVKLSGMENLTRHNGFVSITFHNFPVTANF